jgi:GMP synthase (glutamine-hydrolysing)
MRPFVLLASRPEDDAADAEYDAMLQFTGLTPETLVRIRMDSGPMPPIDLDRFSAVIVGGSPFTSSDPMESKSATQLRVESEISALLDDVVAQDFPFLGACYGVGTLGLHQGGVVDRTYGEPVGAVPVSLTPSGREDPLFAGMPDTFDAFVGHKEALTIPPPHAEILASSPRCPVQAFRVGQNVYATQFHPELDVPGIITRIEIYQHAGYFPAETTQALIAEVSRQAVGHPPQVLANFVRRYAR